ncbi:phenylalanine 4-monooxygenase [Streptomyces sp. ASQP_92]|uniref:phenylalanine 4-monooxygenase n=1 Tax=Streptomyces sp. ASQP_92 TaxID=2979116 RepID=UPI0021C1118F|nr:phenylalanine 4-monooxygenase [Streptomyces sp. ASQP_92]MCT9094069.1 phenylalanine 4-monooxygenase [Streptomyces sp. ASQP_92]
MSLTPLDMHGTRFGRAVEHPSLADAAYVARRNLIASRACGHQVGEPSPPVSYSEEEHATWRTVHAALRSVQDDWGCPQVLAAREAVPVPPDRVPQHEEVSDRLDALGGFRFTLAGGIVPNKRFLGAMADGYFHAVQYVRHPAMPLYTPEPDVLHDVFGHGIHLADPVFADLYRTVGQAAARVDSDDALDLISRVYWFTLEYGVTRTSRGPRAYGAALLSSYGELSRFARTELRPFDIDDLVRLPYQVDGYQPVLFTVDSMAHLADILHTFLDDFDEATCDRRNLPRLADRGFMNRPAHP